MLEAIFPGLVFGCDVSSVFRSLRLRAQGPASSSIKTVHINEPHCPIPRPFIETLARGPSLLLHIENPYLTIQSNKLLFRTACLLNTKWNTANLKLQEIKTAGTAIGSNVDSMMSVGPRGILFANRGDLR